LGNLDGGGVKLLADLGDRVQHHLVEKKMWKLIFYNNFWFLFNLNFISNNSLGIFDCSQPADVRATIIIFKLLNLFLNKNFKKILIVFYYLEKF
jgi:hypothetical protein